MIVLPALAGCTAHLHDDSAQAAAEKARDQAAALVKSEQQVFDVMASNLSTMSAAEEDTFKQLDADVVAAQARIVRRKKWNELRAEASPAAPGKPPAVVEGMSADLDAILAGIRQELVSADVANDRTKSDLDAANEELARAKARVADWNKKIAVLEKIIELTPGTTAGASVKSLKDFEDKVKEVANSAAKAKIEYVDADGVTQTEGFEAAASSLINVSGVLTGQDPAAGKILAGINNVFTPDAPGLVVTVAGLAKDLAEAQRRLVLARIDSLNRRLEVASRAQLALDQAKEFATLMGTALGDKATFPDDQVVGTALLDLGKDPGKEEGLAKGLRAAEYYVAINGPLKLQVDAARREIARMEHLDSIQQSKLAASGREALVSRGVEALAVYHSGGVKPEEVADLLFRLAHLGFLAWIGAGVQ